MPPLSNKELINNNFPNGVSIRLAKMESILPVNLGSFSDFKLYKLMTFPF
jgi:hypothetical protein